MGMSLGIDELLPFDCQNINEFGMMHMNIIVLRCKGVIAFQLHHFFNVKISNHSKIRLFVICTDILVFIECCSPNNTIFACKINIYP